MHPDTERKGGNHKLRSPPKVLLLLWSLRDHSHQEAPYNSTFSNFPILAAYILVHSISFRLAITMAYEVLGKYSYEYF